MKPYSWEVYEQALKWSRQPYTEASRADLFCGYCPNCGARTYAETREDERDETCVRVCRVCDEIVDEGPRPLSASSIAPSVSSMLPSTMPAITASGVDGLARRRSKLGGSCKKILHLSASSVARKEDPMQIIRKLSLFALLVIIASVVSLLVALVALVLGASDSMARWVAFGVLAGLAALAVVIAMETRFK
jgi:hypothetical protein